MKEKDRRSIKVIVFGNGGRKRITKQIWERGRERETEGGGGMGCNEIEFERAGSMKGD